MSIDGTESKITMCAPLLKTIACLRGEPEAFKEDIKRRRETFKEGIFGCDEAILTRSKCHGFSLPYEEIFNLSVSILVPIFRR